MCEWPCGKSNPLSCSHRASTETKEKFAFAFAFRNELLGHVYTYCLRIRLHHRLTGKLGTEPILPVKQSVSIDTETVREMAYSHWQIRTWIRIRTRTPSLIITLYYAELFTLVQIWIQILVQIVSRMVTVPILGTDVHPKDRYLSQFYYISIRGSESVSEPI